MACNTGKKDSDNDSFSVDWNVTQFVIFGICVLAVVIFRTVE